MIYCKYKMIILHGLPLAILIVFWALVKRGEEPPTLPTAYDEFMAFTSMANLIHMHTHGAEYTWSNGRQQRCYIEVHLDRVLRNTTWVDSWLATSYCTLNRESLDHFPILLNFYVYVRRFSKSFRFSSAWVEYLDFIVSVKHNWDEELLQFIVNPMIRMMVQLKKALKTL